ncbi:MAG: hypothetical protein M1379_08490 [Firmicutes bacterium]|nr:hypothetical protein [Bacillota bacterium]
MVEIQFLTASHIIDLHEDLACDTPGILSQQLLESAVAAPRWYDKLHYQAAALFRSLAKNHAFVDGFIDILPVTKMNERGKTNY